MGETLIVNKLDSLKCKSGIKAFDLIFIDALSDFTC